MSNKQILISLNREFGSGGHEIAQKLSQSLGIKLYDRSMLDEIADSHQIDVRLLEEHDEKKKNRLFGVGAEERIARMQFSFIREKAALGESFIIVGRCADEVLGEYSCLKKIFVSGNEDAKLERVMKIYNLNRKDSLEKMARHDKTRRAYHNHYSKNKWGDSRCYDLCINSSGPGVEKTAWLIEQYLRLSWENEAPL